MTYKYIVSGATGLLGSTLVEVINNYGKQVCTLNKKYLLPTIDRRMLLEKIKSFQCNVFIHCAANTNVEDCEVNPKSCYFTNYLVPEIIASICQEIGIKFVYISSTGIYGEGQCEPYTELDVPKPTTEHHKAKYLAEISCSKVCPNHLILRTGWLFGGDKNRSNNFIHNRVKEARLSGNTIYSDPHQKGNPTYAPDISERILTLIEDGAVGVFNCINEGVATRYEYVSEIIQLVDSNVMVEKSKHPFERVAKVSSNESAINYKMELLGYPSMNHWKVSLKKYIEEYIL